MIQAIIYKEWLKLRWPVLIMTGIFILLIVKIALSVAYGMRFYEPNTFWNEVIMRGYQFYTDIKYVPVLAGIVIAAAQYFPEISANRLKLTLHLPLNENKILISMVSFGTIILLAIFLFSWSLLSVVASFYFPFQVLQSVWFTSLPWFMAGIIFYWALAMVVIEPVWIRRIIMMIISYGIIDALFYGDNFNQYQHSWFWFLLLGSAFSISILYSAQRFRKGVM